MVYTKFAEFADKYQDKKLENNNYFGFDFISNTSGFYHIHCRTFSFKKDEVWLNDFGNHTIMIGRVDDIIGVTSCKANYWDVNMQLYLKEDEF